jgi:hypothetical protein
LNTLYVLNKRLLFTTSKYNLNSPLEACSRPNGLITQVISCAISCPIFCICDLVFDKNHVLSIAPAAIRTPNCMCDTKSYVWHQIAAATPNWIYDLACDLVSSLELEIAHQIAQQIVTRYRMLRVNGSNSMSDTKSQTQQIASAIFTANRTWNRTRETSP